VKARTIGGLDHELDYQWVYSWGWDTIGRGGGLAQSKVMVASDH
jgi:hypothetical protein